MIKYIGWYLIGLIICLLLLDKAVIFINTRFLEIILISTRANDYFQLGFRIFFSYFFGATYFLFKIRKLQIHLTNKQIIFSIIGLIIMLVIIDFIQILITLKILFREQIFVRSILPLWLTFPCVILYFGTLLKYGYKRKDIKWLW